MSTTTAIQWTDYTWSPWLGCRKVSPGCKNCYIVDTPPFKFRGIKHGDQRVRTSASYWHQPRAWNRKAIKDGKRPRVFPSLCDPFDTEVEQTWFNDFFRLILATPHLDWLLLTKRPERVNERMEEFERTTDLKWDGMPDNVWLGASAEDQERADERIPVLLGIPVAVRFLSAEPLLESVDIGLDADEQWCCPACHHRVEPEEIHYEDGCFLKCPDCNEEAAHGEWGSRSVIDWVIVGGESGRNARHCHIDWVRSIVAQCKSSGVSCFVKQMGSNAVGSEMDKWVCRMRHPKCGDPSEWPKDLQVREFPVDTHSRQSDSKDHETLPT